MSNMKISFSPPDISEEEINEVSEVLRSGWITTGPKVKLFENEISKYVGVEKTVCLSSQTSCAETALHILGVGEGDEVITSAYTYTASASVACHVGANVKLIDCQTDSLEMDYDALENAITDKTKVIIPVDIAGIPCDYDRIFDIVERKKNLFRANNDIQSAYGRIIVLADTAHSFGAVRKGKVAGSIADMSSFSFHAVKNLTTAEGGALTWRNINGVSNDEIYRKAQLLSLHGQSKDALAKSQLGAWEYDIVDTWYKCNMTDIAAAIGLAQLRRYPSMLEKRKSIIERFNNALEPLGVKVLEHYTDDHSSSGHLYITRIPGIKSDERNKVIISMAEQGISCNVHYKPLPMHTAYKKRGFNITDYPNAYAAFENEVTLPLHTKLTDEEVDYIINCYTKIIKR